MWPLLFVNFFPRLVPSGSCYAPSLRTRLLGNSWNCPSRAAWYYFQEKQVCPKRCHVTNDAYLTDLSATLKDRKTNTHEWNSNFSNPHFVNLPTDNSDQKFFTSPQTNTDFSSYNIFQSSYSFPWTDCLSSYCFSFIM